VEFGTVSGSFEWTSRAVGTATAARAMAEFSREVALEWAWETADEDEFEEGTLKVGRGVEEPRVISRAAST